MSLAWGFFFLSDSFRVVVGCQRRYVRSLAPFSLVMLLSFAQQSCSLFRWAVMPQCSLSLLPASRFPNRKNALRIILKKEKCKFFR